MKFKVEKNKTFPPKRTGEYDIYVDDCVKTGVKKGQIDRLKEVTKYGVLYGIIARAGAWFYIDKGSEQELKFQGGEPLLEYLRNTPEKMDEIAERVMAVVLTGKKANGEVDETYVDEDGRTINTATGEITEN